MSAVVVRPTISQCQSRALAADPREISADTSARRDRERLARIAAAIGTISAAPRSVSPTRPSSANVSTKRECASRTIRAAGRCSYHRTSNVPAPVPTTGCSVALSQATRIVSARPAPDALKSLPLRLGPATGSASKRSRISVRVLAGPPIAATATTKAARTPAASMSAVARRRRGRTGTLRARRCAAHPDPAENTITAATTHASRCPSRVAAAATSVLGRERVLTRGYDHAHDRRRSERNERPEHRDPPRVERDRRGQPDAQREPGASREREVQGGHERRSRRSRGDRRPGSPGVRNDPDGEDDAERRQEPEGVPVPERLCQSVRVERTVVRIETIREKPRGEPVRRKDRDAHQRSGEYARPVAAPQHERDRQCDCDVHEHALDLPDGRRRADRPDGGQRHPEPERDHEASRTRSAAAQGRQPGRG